MPATRPLRRFLAASLLLVAGAASAQVAKPRAQALPVWNQSSGKVEAVLLLEPVTTGTWQFGNSRLDSALGVGSGDTLGLLCDRKPGLASAIGNLADNCLLASLGNSRNARQANAGASLVRKGGRLGVGFGNSRDVLPSWLAPGKANSRVNQNTLTLIGEKNIGREATVSIAGTLARARLVAPDAVPELADRWDIKTLSVGTNVGRFGANVIGRVIESPQDPGRWEGLDLGLSWRTPWRGQLSVGAENVVTRGRNPFAPRSDDKDEGAIPYVRYQQDL
ncbi:hypothetical protein GCM10008101_03280 [Lysobacter xinjiangensis]|uniref:TonB dependent receptor n=1 Tax=Cognatilysobacter xinjiangensis TaxID=546892 RepID=A0ABQ3BT09_9GAMM|nr:hypothetical protein [Lysobacter xinjiangensis]GGZ53484.1 hypothetical protein GCM10008101_03280 [Lysobacter xinjiangensis]